MTRHAQFQSNEDIEYAHGWLARYAWARRYSRDIRKQTEQLQRAIRLADYRRRTTGRLQDPSYAVEFAGV